MWEGSQKGKIFNVCNWSWKGFEKTRRPFCNLKGRVKVMMMQKFIMEKHCHSLDESLINFLKKIKSHIWHPSAYGSFNESVKRH